MPPVWAASPPREETFSAVFPSQTKAFPSAPPVQNRSPPGEKRTMLTNRVWPCVCVCVSMYCVCVCEHVLCVRVCVHVRVYCVCKCSCVCVYACVYCVCVLCVCVCVCVLCVCRVSLHGSQIHTNLFSFGVAKTERRPRYMSVLQATRAGG